MLSRLTYLPRRHKSFISRVLDNLRSEFSQNKEIKENLQKFRMETQKLEQTEALKQAREKFKIIEESSKDAKVLQNLKLGVEMAKNAEIFKRTASFGATAKDFIKQGTDKATETTAFKKMSELSDSDSLYSLYKPPPLLKRSERSIERQVKPNDGAKSVELHADSKWSQNWNKFKDENQYINQIFEFKMKYDESSNPLVRATRTLADRVGDIMSGLFQRTDLSNVLTEICKADPNFDINVFMEECEKIIIPTILEAMVQNRLDILSDWCHEAVYNVLSRPLQEATKLGLKIHSRVLDLQNLELAMGKMMEQGPVLVFTFHAQQINYVTDPKGNIVEGDPDKIVQNTYVMAFCRDQDDFNPGTAWRLIDVAMQQSQIFF